MARLFTQAGAVATRTGLVADQLGKLLAHGNRVGFLVAAFQIGDDAFECVVTVEARAFLVEIAEADDLVSGTVEHDVANAFRQFV